MRQETPADDGRGLENPGGRRVPSQDTTDLRHGNVAALCASVLDGTAQPHELPPLLHDLWRDGFRLGNQAAQARIDRAERAADWWYYVANNPAEARAEHERTLKHFDVMEYRRKRKGEAA